MDGSIQQGKQFGSMYRITGAIRGSTVSSSNCKEATFINMNSLTNYLNLYDGIKEPFLLLPCGCIKCRIARNEIESRRF